MCAAMSGGFYFFSVITDPVELWSPELSQTRQNKNYYDTHFRPFYRTTQFIIRPTNNTPWIHETFNDPGTQFASTFQLDFLLQVLDLQNTISSLKGEMNTMVNGTNTTRIVSLKDICFAPLLPDNDNCTVQSVLNYWQNDPNNLFKVVTDDFGQILYDYITHLQNCVAGPTTVNDTVGLGCMGDFGGTVMPFVGLGG